MKGSPDDDKNKGVSGVMFETSLSLGHSVSLSIVTSRHLVTQHPAPRSVLLLVVFPR